MKYLFLDLEYATSKGGVSKICEFGFVITNEKFEVQKKGNMIINPSIDKNDWDYRVLRKILTRRRYQYEKKPNFVYYFKRIEKLIVSADYIFGHTLYSDAKAINDECIRYGLKSIDYDFYDVKVFYKDYKQADKKLGLVDSLQDLGIQIEGTIHDAESDAYNTMLELKAILEKREISINELIELCPNAKDRTKNYIVKSLKEKQDKEDAHFKEIISGDGTNDLEKSALNKKRYRQFLDNVKTQNIYGTKFKNKKVCLSSLYEHHHYRQVLNLVQLVENEGGKVVLLASTANVFVKYDRYEEDLLIKDPRLECVLAAKENGSYIEIIDFLDFLHQLGITEQELDELPMISFDFFFKDDAVIKDKKDCEIISRIKSAKEKTKKYQNQ